MPSSYILCFIVFKANTKQLRISFIGKMVMIKSNWKFCQVLYQNSIAMFLIKIVNHTCELRDIFLWITWHYIQVDNIIKNTYLCKNNFYILKRVFIKYFYLNNSWKSSDISQKFWLNYGTKKILISVSELRDSEEQCPLTEWYITWIKTSS